MSSSAPVKIGTRSYTVDLSGVIRRPLNSIRQMVDQGLEAGEQSLDNQGVWRRTQWDFVLGAGQKYFDEVDESTRRRHRTSRGCDVLSDRRQISTIKKASLKSTISGTAFLGRVIRTPSNFWVSNEGGLSRTASLTSFTMTTVTGGPGSATTDLAHFGANVYAAYGTPGIYRGSTTGSTVTLWTATDTTLLHVAHGRMIGAHGVEVFELDTTATKTSIYSHPDTAFTWSAVCAAPNGIYIAGSNSNRTEIHLITVVDATGALAPPIPVAEFPSGERVNRMAFFGGFLYFATTKGVRIGNVVGGGAVVYGPLLRVGNVRGIHSDGRFAYFTWDAMDVDTAYGIGRLSLERFTSELVPAYCPDLSVTSGLLSTRDVASDSEIPVFIGEDASNTKLYAAHDTDYEVATYYSGKVMFGIPERKAAVSIEGRWDALPSGAQVKVEVLDAYTSENFGGISNSQTGSTQDKASFSVPAEAEEFEVKVTLTPNPSTPTSPVTFRRWTLRAVPMPYKAEEIWLPVILSERVRGDDGSQVQVNVKDEWDYLFGLMQARSRVDFTFGSATAKAYVDKVAVDPGGGFGWFEWDRSKRWPKGTVMVNLITVEDGI